MSNFKENPSKEENDLIQKQYFSALVLAFDSESNEVSVVLNRVFKAVKCRYIAEEQSRLKTLQYLSLTKLPLTILKMILMFFAKLLM